METDKLVLKMYENIKGQEELRLGWRKTMLIILHSRYEDLL